MGGGLFCVVLLRVLEGLELILGLLLCKIFVVVDNRVFVFVLFFMVIIGFEFFFLGERIFEVVFW